MEKNNNRKRKYPEKTLTIYQSPDDRPGMGDNTTYVEKDSPDDYKFEGKTKK